MFENYVEREIGGTSIDVNLSRKIIRPKIGFFGLFRDNNTKQFEKEQIIGELTINVVADYESVEKLYHEIAYVIQKWYANNVTMRTNNDEQQLIEE